MLYKFIGAGGGANSGKGYECAGRCEFQEAARERENIVESPLEWPTQDHLERGGILASRLNSRCGG